MDDMDRLIDRCTDRDGRVDKLMLHARGVLSDNNLFGPDEVNPDPLGGAPLVEAKGFSAEGMLGDRGFWVAVFWGGELGERVSLRGHDAEWVSEHLRGELAAFDDPAAVLTALTDRGVDVEWNGDDPRRR